MTNPEIKKFFNCNLLLKKPLRDNSETLLQIMEYIDKKLWKKLDRCPNKKKRCEKLKKEFLDLYEQIKNEEKKSKKETNNKTKGFFYSINLSSKSNGTIFRRLKYKGLRYANEKFKNN